jgi:pimeloyl-ACP methyl ester carboxylesterase
MKFVVLIVLAALATNLALSGCATMKAERLAPPIGEFVEVDGARIHLLDIGPRDAAGPAIVLIHGASVNLRDMNLALGAPLAASHRVIVVDRPGRGYSTRPRDGWRIDVQARLIHEAVRARGVERPVIVGQSFGGAVALSYALQFQDDLAGLVLLAAVSHEWPGGVAWYNNVSGWPVIGAAFRRLVIPLYAPMAARSGVGRSFSPGAAPPAYYEESGLPLLFRPADFKANAADLRRLKPQIVAQSRRYGELRLQTAVITGDADTTVSPTIHSAAMAREIAGARLTVIPGAGHALHHTHKDVIIAEIERIAAAGADR